MPKPDEAHLWTDGELEKLEERIAAIYKEAADELKEKIDAYFESFKKRDEEMKALIGTIQNGREWTEQDYKQWRLAQIGRAERFEALRDKIADRMKNASDVAMAYINDTTPGIYSLNRNYAAYTIEQVAGDVGFDLWDEQTVKRLIVEQPDLMPYYSKIRAAQRGLDIEKSKRKITAQITSGIFQGKSIKGLADDLQKRIPTMNRNSAIRTARTAVTGAQNAGRIDSYTAAEKMGIELQKEWLATLDGRTRHSHAMLDGVKVDNDKKFPNGCRFPGDPEGPPHEIYNCFVGETQIASDSDIVRSYKHRYDGNLIKVETARGVNFTCTPNHPILTPSGWVVAASLNNGDNLLVATIGDGEISRRNPYINHIHPRMDALHELFYVVFGKRTCNLGVNFHGDVPTTNVEIVTKKWLLWGNRNPGISERINELLLKCANESFMGKRPFMKHIWSICKPPLRIISSLRKSPALFRGSLSHAVVHGFGKIPGGDPSVTQNTVNDLTAESKIRSELFSGFTSEVSVDKVVNVKVIPSGSTHVYNLQTENGYYFVNSSIAQNKGKCNGIFAIAHNCRCTLIAAIKDVDTSNALRRARNPVTGESVMIPNMTYAQWESWKKTENRYAWDTYQKKGKNLSSDQKQFEKYKRVLGKNTPKTFAEFQDLKYNDPEKWSFLKLDYARQNKLRNHPKLALPGAETAKVPDRKITDYLFNPQNKDGWAKGEAFTSRLGYSAENWKSLQSEIRRCAKLYTALLKAKDEYGQRYEQCMVLYGKNSRPANVIVGWIQRPDGSTSMTTAYIKEVQL